MPTPLPFPMQLDPTSPPGLHELEACEAMRLAVEQSVKDPFQIRREMGWSESFYRRVMSAEKFFPSYQDLPKFCAVAGNMVAIQWLLARAVFHGLEAHNEDLTCQILLTRVTDIFSDAGDVASSARAAVEDNALAPRELRQIIAALSLVLNDGMTLLSDLRAQIKTTPASRAGVKAGARVGARSGSRQGA